MAIKFKELKLSLNEEQLDEAKGKPPFDPDPKSKKTPRNSDGTKTSGMSRARQLAKRGMKLKEGKDSKAYAAASKEVRAVKDPIEGANLKKLAIILDRLGKVSLINSGDLLNQFNKIWTGMDTDVREVVYNILKKQGLMEEKRVASSDQVTEEVELDEAAYGTRAQRMMSPLQKIRQDKEKADRDRDGKLKSTIGRTSKKKKEEVELDEAAKIAANWKKGAEGIKQVSRLQISKDMKATFNDMIRSMEALAKSPNILQASGFIATVNKDYGILAKNKDIKDELDKALKKAGLMESLQEQPEEEKPMMKGQIESMEHYLEGIEEYLESTPDPEEWFQNKLTKAHSELSSLYSYSKGEDGDDDDVEESTKAYGKSMRAVADKKKRDAMTSSDKDKLGKLAAMMAKERGKRK